MARKCHKRMVEIILKENHSFIDSFIQQIVVELLLCARLVESYALVNRDHLISSIVSAMGIPTPKGSTTFKKL